MRRLFEVQTGLTKGLSPWQDLTEIVQLTLTVRARIGRENEVLSARTVVVEFLAGGFRNSMKRFLVGLVCISMLALTSGCVVHARGHGDGHGHVRARGKVKVKVKRHRHKHKRGHAHGRKHKSKHKHKHCHGKKKHRKCHRHRHGGKHH